MRKVILRAAVAACLALPAAYVQAQPATAPRTGAPMGASGGTQQLTAQDFVNQAAVSGMFEIQSSKLVLGKLKGGKRARGDAAAGQGGNDQVRDFAQRMVQDHTQADKQLKSVLKEANVKVKPPKKLDAQHRQLLQQLKSAKGDQLARDYANIQVRAHQDAVTLFESYAQNGDNAQLKQFAQQTLPTLQEHLRMAQQLSK